MAMKTTMFDVIRGRGMTIEGFCRVGEGEYTAQYLRAIAAGVRPVPQSDKFQEWVANTLRLPRSVLFFDEEFASANAPARPANAEVA